jgi:hypothetical protein
VVHEAINGRENAARIIIDVAHHRQS